MNREFYFGGVTQQARGIPDDMRALIDEAVTAGRVTRVPTGASGIPLPRWCPVKKALFEGKPKGKSGEAYAAVRERANRAQAAQAAVRRAEIARLMDDGMSPAEIAAFRGEGTHSVFEICRRIRAQRRDGGGAP